MKHSFTGLSLILLWVVLFTPHVFAHKVTLFAWVEGDTVYTESKFSAGKMVKDGKVEVFDSQGNRLLNGRTNDIGEFSFKVPKITDLNIVLTAGMGHQNSWRLSAVELGEETFDPSAPGSVPSEPLASDSNQETMSAEAKPDLSAREIEAIVARQLEQKLRPLTRMLTASQETGPALSDIFGGVGYIIGLVGLGAYVRYRKDNRRL